jgi:ADP-heptose:LPS heptosyltransferase
MKNIVIVIPYRGIGDMIFHLPFLKTLYKNYNKKIIIVTNPVNKSKHILKNEKFLKKIIYINFSRNNFIETISRSLILKKTLDKLNAELLILTSPSKALVLPAYFSNAKKKIFLGTNSNNFLKKVVNFIVIHLAEHLKSLLKSLKFNRYEFSYQLNNSWINEKFNEYKHLKKPWIFLNIDSHHNQNNWDMNSYKKIIDRVKNKTIFINTSPDNLDYFINDLERYKNNKNIIVTSSFDITKLIRIISKCKIIIGNESGPICLGAALGKKVFSMYSEKHTKPESYVISNKIKYFNTDKLRSNAIINSIHKYIIKNL